MSLLSPQKEKQYANAIRFLSADSVEAAQSGHPGMPMGMADVASVLFRHFLVFDAEKPDWANRDRFVLSAGHGSMLLYALLYLCGVKKMTINQLRQFRQWGSLCAGHPEHMPEIGIETTTGPLGQGLANAVGMALAERMATARFGSKLVDHYTYVIAGDGCLMEGISHEAIGIAGHLCLSKLILLFDDNSISIDGPVSLSASEDTPTRFKAAGWKTLSIDGHNPEEIYHALEQARQSDKPTMIACKTRIGFGAPNKEGSEETHGKALGANEIAAMRKNLNWPHPAFHIPDSLLEAWRSAGKRNQPKRKSWEEGYTRLPPEERKNWEDFITRSTLDKAGDIVDLLREEWKKTPLHVASRQSSQRTLEKLVAAIPNLIGGSADLTGSNNTKTNANIPITRGDYSGNYLYYGIREHGMAAVMNGLSLYGGFVPYGGTFLVFSDYCRPSIRLAALMKQQIIYVMTHDSIFLGEDGPTHQPVEHLAALRAMPNLLVLRPCDAIETAECWQIALENRKGPSVLVLSRQSLPSLTRTTAMQSAYRGAWLVYGEEKKRAATLLASGSEVSLAIEAASLFEKEGVKISVVAIPCFEIFDQQDPDWKQSLLGDAPRLAVEAAAPFGWARYVKSEDDIVGIKGFGASAPAETLREKFGFTAENVAAKLRALIV